jgi:hypothetical protein
VSATSVPKRREVEAAVKGVTQAGEVAAVGRRGKADGSERGNIGGVQRKAAKQSVPRTRR